MPIMTVEQALDNLEHAQARGNVHVDLEVRVANLRAAVAKASADATGEASDRLGRAIGASVAAQERARETTITASEVLERSIKAVTDASNANTEEMSKWAKSTSRWTMALTLATIALVLTAGVQIVIMWLSLKPK